VHHLQETNLWHVFWRHLKNNLGNIQNVVNSSYLKHLGLENRKKCLQFCFQISANVLHVDGISESDFHYCAKNIFTITIM